MEPIVRVLVVEDDRDLALNISEYLGDRGCAIDTAEDGVTGLHLAIVNEFDVIVLDLILPGMGGIDVCRKLRRDAHKLTPVLMLTARDTLEQKLLGFQSGADDYVTKPFALAELRARLVALAGRGRRHRGRVLKVADLSYNVDTLVVLRAGTSIWLNPIELKLLRALMDASPSVVNQHDLKRQIWGNEEPGLQGLCMAVHRLRAAIDEPFGKPMICTSHGGYRMVDPSTTATRSPLTVARRSSVIRTLGHASHRAL